MSALAESHTISVESEVLDKINTKEGTEIRQLTDVIRSYGVETPNNIPKIVVLGKRSAGKSSVLEAISHVRFPVGNGGCTRFATELLLRRSETNSIDVSVRFADPSKSPKAFRRKSFRDDDMPDVIKEAKKYMGLSDSNKGISKDVLCVQISGPNVSPMTLIDLPGLLFSRSDPLWEDKKTADELADSYMKQKDIIILAVIPANESLPTSTVIDRAKLHDPDLERTIGVITKPDLPKDICIDEQTHLSLAKNQDSACKLKNEWHVLRARGEGEDDFRDRDADEVEFFKSGPWASLPPKNRGIASLREKLGGVFLNCIRKDLGNVVVNVEKMLEEAEEELQQLGPLRSTPVQQRSFLIDIAQKLQRLAECGVEGRYNDPFFGDIDDTTPKFRSRLRNYNNAFEITLSRKGSKLAIVQSGDAENPESHIREHLKDFVETYSSHCPQPEPIHPEDLIARLKKVAASKQGRAFAGSSSRDLAIQLFQYQASPWKRIASFHIKQIVLLAKAFVEQIVQYLVGQPEVSCTSERLLRNYVDTFFARKQKILSDKLEELLRPFERGYAMPHESEFHDIVKQRMAGRLHSYFPLSTTGNSSTFDLVHESALIKLRLNEAANNPESQDQSFMKTSQVVEMMLPYYEISRRTFADNVITLAIESCLVDDLATILTPAKVNEMTEAELKEIVGETTNAQLRREQLTEEVDVLQKSIEKCRKHLPRTATVMPLVVSARSVTPQSTPVKQTSTAQQPLPNEPFKGSTQYSSTQSAILAPSSLSLNATTSSKSSLDDKGNQCTSDNEEQQNPPKKVKQTGPGSPEQASATSDSKTDEKPLQGAIFSPRYNTGISIQCQSEIERSHTKSLFNNSPDTDFGGSVSSMIPSVADRVPPRPLIQKPSQGEPDDVVHCHMYGASEAMVSPEEDRVFVYRLKQLETLLKA